MSADVKIFTIKNYYLICLFHLIIKNIMIVKKEYETI